MSAVTDGDAELGFQPVEGVVEHRLGFGKAAQPDLVLSAKDGYAFSNETTGEEIVTQQRPTGSHGYLQSNPRLDALFVMGGRGVRKGAAVERVRNLDVAPTIAQLLGLRLENVEGAPLTELLERSR